MFIGYFNIQTLLYANHWSAYQTLLLLFESGKVYSARVRTF